MEDEEHEMILEKIYESGVEEWFCPECGRRFLQTWPPNYCRWIIEEGDPDVRHYAGKGGAAVRTEVQATEDGFIETYDPGLDPFNEWFEKINFDKLWKGGY